MPNKNNFYKFCCLFHIWIFDFRELLDQKVAKVAVALQASWLVNCVVVLCSFFSFFLVFFLFFAKDMFCNGFKIDLSKIYLCFHFRVKGERIYLLALILI